MIEPDDCEPEDFTQPWADTPAILSTRAKDMTGFTGVLIRNYAENGMADQLRHDYGINEDEAWLSLKCADLATLPAWDADTLLDAATAYLVHGNEMARRFGYIVEGNIPADVERVKRRIRLAMLAEKAPDVMSPADGVLLLRRAGIDVFYELLDAVAASTLEPFTLEAQGLYRRLKGIAEPQQTAPADAAAKSAGASGKRWTEENLAELKAYRAAHTAAETAVQFRISTSLIRKLLPGPKLKAKPFPGLVHRAK